MEIRAVPRAELHVVQVVVVHVVALAEVVVVVAGEIKIKVLNLTSGKNFYYRSCIPFAWWLSNI